MPVFTPPIQDMAFAIQELAGLETVAALPGFEEATPDLLKAILVEAGRFGAEILAPLNPVGDRLGCRIEDGTVRTAPGFKEAYARFVASGWNAVSLDARHGGQGLPVLAATAIQEIWQAANMAFGLWPMLTQGAAEALSLHGSDEQKRVYLPRLVSGEWTGTMALTEPQAGSDVGQARTTAVRDGRAWRITGQKIFITGGDHDLTDNIVHFVLARTQGAPAGSGGLSLFLVPKMLVRPDGTLGAPNDVRCLRLEEKLGIHASPTCVMAFGEAKGAIGTLIGEEGRGLALMFTLMNSARLAVGLQGIGQAERAYQKAAAYARQRVQGRTPGGEAAAIIRHPDVRRLLMTSRALIEASRALAYYVAGQVDISRRHPDSHERDRARSKLDLLIPVVKAWSTAIGIRVADSAIQVHGGMGVIEEAGIAQHLRDVRVAAIYEGTNGIQAMDLVSRKLIGDRGAAFRALLEDIRAQVDGLARCPGEAFDVLRRRLAEAVDAAEAAGRRILSGAGTDPWLAGSAATPFLDLMGLCCGGWMMAGAASAASRRMNEDTGDAAFLSAKITTARFYAEALLPQAGALLAAVEAGSGTIMALEDDQF